jgi:HD superfamily phosphodiesterase
VTHGHIRRVAVGDCARASETTQADLRAVEAAAILHDVGKLAVRAHSHEAGQAQRAEFGG